MMPEIAVRVDFHAAIQHTQLPSLIPHLIALHRHKAVCADSNDKLLCKGTLQNLTEV